MRGLLIGIVGIALASGCTKGAKQGEEEARQEADRIQKEKERTGGVAKTIRPPVPGQTKIPCTQLLDNLEKFQQVTGEVEPLTMKDISKSDADAVSSCSLMRGGKRPTTKEQEAIRKKQPRLGVLAGDELCNVTAYCSTIEDPEKFKAKCVAKKDRGDESMGTYACIQIVAQGVDDVQVFRFFDEDTKCIVQVRGGPSNVDNELIKKCAIAARDMITPKSIEVPPAGNDTPPAPPAGSGSAPAGSGS